MKRRDFLLGASAAAITWGQANAAGAFFTGYPNDIRDWTARYFKAAEFASRGNGKLRNLKRKVAALDDIRATVGHPIVILSGHRDEAYNRKIGGARYSRHVVGDAVDISLRGLSDIRRYQLMWLLLSKGFMSFGSYARYPTMLHADMRPEARIWRYGGGNHAAWFSQALADWGWQRGVGANRRPQAILAQK